MAADTAGDAIFFWSDLRKKPRLRQMTVNQESNDANDGKD